MACAQYKRLGCKARAHLPPDCDVSEILVVRPHNHPPDVNIAEKRTFLERLKCAVTTLPGSLKSIYEGIAEL